MAELVAEKYVINFQLNLFYQENPLHLKIIIKNKFQKVRNWPRKPRTLIEGRNSRSYLRSHFCINLVSYHVERLRNWGTGTAGAQMSIISEIYQSRKFPSFNVQSLSGILDKMSLQGSVGKQGSTKLSAYVRIKVTTDEHAVDKSNLSIQWA